VDTKQSRLAGKAGVLAIDVPALTADVYATATDFTNVHNKTGNMCH
jgi:hypothetical protein